MRSSAAGLSRALVMEALLLGNGLVAAGRRAAAGEAGVAAGEGPSQQETRMKLPKSLRRAQKGLRAGLGVARKAIGSAGGGAVQVEPLPMQALPGLEPPHT